MFLAKKNETLPSKGKFVSVRFAELAQNESFTASLGSAPQGILPADSSDQIADLARNRRPAGFAAPHFPDPE